MLGTQRTLISTAAGALQDAGLIYYRYGKITILDAQGLEAVTCACYGIVRRETEAGQYRLLKPGGPVYATTRPA